jgi:hypothetical protein
VSFFLLIGDVWMDIFQLISYKTDLSTVFTTKAVCKRWMSVFTDSPLTIATILEPNTINWYVKDN